MKLATAVHEYIAFKRSMGMRFRSQAVTLQSFCRTLGPIEIAQVDAQSVLAFLSPSKSLTGSWHQKFSTLHGFYRFALPRRYAAVSPLPTTRPKGPPSAPPYIYSTHELHRLLEGAQILDRRHRHGGLSTLTFRTLLLLLYSTGLRISEALSLTGGAVNLVTSLLTIRDSKFFKSRLVPIGPQLTAVLHAYASERQHVPGRLGVTSAFFVTRRGAAVARHTAERSFRFVRQQAGLQRRDAAYFQPRLHDLRHSFAVHRLVTWYRQGADVQKLLPHLSTYLGHVGIAETQAYLRMTPELLREANRRFEQYALSEVSHAG